MRLLICAVVLASVCQAEHRVTMYIQAREVGARHPRNITLEMTRELMKVCPGSVSITDSEPAAEVRLSITPGASILYVKDGTAEHVFGTKYMISRLGKEVCAYLQKRP